MKVLPGFFGDLLVLENIEKESSSSSLHAPSLSQLLSAVRVAVAGSYAETSNRTKANHKKTICKNEEYLMLAHANISFEKKGVVNVTMLQVIHDFSSIV